MAAPLEIIFHQRRQLRENIGHPPPRAFHSPSRVQRSPLGTREGVGMDGHLIEIVGAPPL